MLYNFSEGSVSEGDWNCSTGHGFHGYESKWFAELRRDEQGFGILEVSYLRCVVYFSDEGGLARLGAFIHDLGDKLFVCYE